MQTSESDASDLLSEILSHNAELNDLFIEMVENIHMKQRMMAVAFSMAKDKYIDSNFRNTLSELSSDLINYGSDIILRKLLISSIALAIAQDIGGHAATEELYYYMRKNEAQTHENIDGFYNRIRRQSHL